MRRLTPNVIELEKDMWCERIQHNFIINNCNISNFNYCLDILIKFLIKQQSHNKKIMTPKFTQSDTIPMIYVGKPIYSKPDTQSEVMFYIPLESRYDVISKLTGFNGKETFLHVRLYLDGVGSTNVTIGYVLEEIF